mgnify:CR=1 FL=1
MEEIKNLADLTKDISDMLIQSIEIINIIDEITYDDTKIAPLINIINDNIKKAFNINEQCRIIISKPE